MSQLLTTAASDAFLDVGVVLALVTLAVLVVGDRCSRVVGLLERLPALGPLLGGLLGVTPGCSGALLLAPLYAAGRVSPGTMVATLLATTGDSAWAMWAGAPRTAAVVHAVTLGVGVVCGILVDRSRLSEWLRPERRDASGTHGRRPVAEDDRGRDVPAGAPRPRRPAALPAPTLRVDVLLPVLAVFWLSTGAGAAWTLGVGQPPPLQELLGTDWRHLAGLLGFVACVLLLLRSRRAARSGTPASPRPVVLLERAAGQAAFVVVWVGVAYAVLAMLEAVAGPVTDSLHLVGPLAVVAGVLVGALPGCGLQIAWTGLYLDGAVGLPGLLANALAQDGDALLPLLVLQRRSALALTAATSVPALAVGSLAVLLV